MHECRFITDCVNANGDDINEMVDAELEISLRTFLEHVNIDDLYSVLPYERDPRKGMTLRQDWAICFYRSKYRGDRCYFVKWSAIEFVFQEVD